MKGASRRKSNREKSVTPRSKGNGKGHLKGEEFQNDSGKLKTEPEGKVAREEGQSQLEKEKRKSKGTNFKAESSDDEDALLSESECEEEGSSDESSEDFSMREGRREGGGVEQWTASPARKSGTGSGRKSGSNKRKSKRNRGGSRPGLERSSDPGKGRPRFEQQSPFSPFFGLPYNVPQYEHVAGPGSRGKRLRSGGHRDQQWCDGGSLMPQLHNQATAALPPHPHLLLLMQDQFDRDRAATQVAEAVSATARSVAEASRNRLLQAVLFQQCHGYM